MEKYFSKPFLQPIAKVDDLSVFKSGRTPLPPICGKPIAQVDHLIHADLSVFELERTSLPPINAKVQAQQALNLGTPYGETTFQSSMAHNITTEPQLPAAWSIHDIFTEVPNKSRKIIKRTLKEKHISKRSMCHMVQQTVEWVRMLCMDVVLPALLLCLIEEDCMKKEAQLHQKRAGEWIQMKSGEVLNRSTEEAKMIGVNIFLCMMDCLHSKNASVRSDAEGSASSQMTSGYSISRETIHMFTADLISCVYQELLDNDMGKAYPPKYLCSDVSENSSWEFYLSVLHHFFQQAAKNHVGLFLGLPDILLQDGPNNMEEIWQACGLETMTYGEKTSLNVLTKIVTDIGMDKISDAIEDPLCSAEIVRQGEKSLAQYFNVASRREEPEQPEVWGSSSKPATPEPENLFNPSPEIQAESFETAEDVQLKEIHGRSSSSTDALLDLDEELEELLRRSPKPATPEPTKVFSSSAQIQQEPLKSYKVSKPKNLPGESSAPTRKLLDPVNLIDQELDELEHLGCATKLGTPEPKTVVHLPCESSSPADLLLDDDDSLDRELEELLRSSSKPATPKPTKVYSSRSKIHAESPESREDIEVEHTNPAPTDSPPQLEHSLHQSPAPTGKRRRKLKNKSKGPVSQGRRQKRHREETVKEETSSFRAAELPTAKAKGFILPQHFIESVIDGLLTTLQSTYNISVPGLYLYDVLFNKLVQELGSLARVHVVKNILTQQPFHDEDEIVLRIVKEAHDIVKDKGYLRAAWQDHEMSVNYLTKVVSAVILDYTVLGGWNQKTYQTEDYAIPVCPSLTVKEKCRNFLSRMRQSLQKVFCFK